ncbi:hypothetical protein KI387_016754, partial [Taxus chinensis]
ALKFLAASFKGRALDWYKSLTPAFVDTWVVPVFMLESMFNLDDQLRGERWNITFKPGHYGDVKHSHLRRLLLLAKRKDLDKACSQAYYLEMDEDKGSSPSLDDDKEACVQTPYLLVQRLETNDDTTAGADIEDPIAFEDKKFEKLYDNSLSNTEEDLGEDEVVYINTIERKPTETVHAPPRQLSLHKGTLVIVLELIDRILKTLLSQ